MVKFQDERGGCVPGSLKQLNREEEPSVLPVVPAQVVIAQALFRKEVEVLSTSGQRQVLLKVCRHLRERTLTWPLRALHRILIHKMNFGLDFASLTEDMWLLSNFYG